MTFSDVVGQDYVIRTLQNAIVSGRVGHAYLFSGPRGTGKTSMARLLAKAVNCLHPDPGVRPCNECDHCLAMNDGSFMDLIEIDAASHTSVDDVRDLREKIAFSPSRGSYKVYIIDEVHRFSGAAFDALLKTLEEPPPHAIFILATTEIHKVPQTIQSRCQRFDFRRIPLDQIVWRLSQIAEYEGVTFDVQALELIARQSTGAMRDSISLLDQLMPDPGGHLTLADIQAIIGTTTDVFTFTLIDLLLQCNSTDGLRIINDAINDGHDSKQIAAQIVEHLRALMIAQTGGIDLLATEYSDEALGLIQQQAANFPSKALLSSLSLFNDAFSDRNQAINWYPQLPLEISFLESINVIFAEEPTQAEAHQSNTPYETSVTKTKKSDSGQGEKEHSNEIPEASLSLETPTSASDTPLNLLDAADKWRMVGSIARQISNSFEAQGMANSASVINVSEDTITVQVKSSLLKEKFEKEGNFSAIQQAAEKVYKRPIYLRCVVGNDNNPAEDKELTSDAVLAYAVNELGGKVKKLKKGEAE